MPEGIVTTQREFALEVVRRLRDAGHETLWAGGCVRDALLDKTPKDYDVATAALPEQVREVFGKRRTIPVGAAFGVITVLGPKSLVPVEVATFRTDGGYSDGRRPDSVQFSSAEEDAARRDFTINGLFYDPIQERVIDYVGGEADLRAGLVRAIGVAEDRIAEDRLRMLRAVRFAATLGFRIDSETLEAIQKHADQIISVSGERIGAEIKRMLTSAGASEAIRLLDESGLLNAVLPEATPIAAVRRLSLLAAATPASALAAATIDSANPDQIHAAARRLKWTAKESDTARWLATNVGDIEEACRRSWSRLQPLLAHDAGVELVDLYRTQPDADSATLRHCEEKLSLPAGELNPEPLLVGADLIAAGLRPGPDFAKLLAQVRTAQLDGEVATREEALSLIGLDAN